MEHPKNRLRIAAALVIPAVWLLTACGKPPATPAKDEQGMVFSEDEVQPDTAAKPESGDQSQGFIFGEDEVGGDDGAGQGDASEGYVFSEDEALQDQADLRPPTRDGEPIDLGDQGVPNSSIPVPSSGVYIAKYDFRTTECPDETIKHPPQPDIQMTVTVQDGGDSILLHAPPALAYDLELNRYAKGKYASAYVGTYEAPATGESTDVNLTYFDGHDGEVMFWGDLFSTPGQCFDTTEFTLSPLN